MTYLGQCPCCHVTYELRPGDIGQLIECECDATLLCCQVIPASTVDLVCHQCGESYEVSSEDAGQQVECECGHRLIVPNVALRQPLGCVADAKAASDDQPWIIQSDNSAHANEVETGAESPTVNADPFAITVAEPLPKTRESAPSVQNSRPKKTDPLSLLGVAAVVVLLLTATVMFFRRDLSPAPSTVVRSDQPNNVRPTSNDAPPDSEALLTLATTPPDVATHIDKPEVRTSEPTASGNDQFPIPSAPLYAIPSPQQARRRIPVSTERQPYMTLRTGVVEAFEAYEETQDLMHTAEQSKSDTDRFAYEQSMGRTLALIQHMHDLAVKEKDLEQMNSMRYLLAYLYYTAGHLPESCIMGESLARWGAAEDPATKEAAMIALSAAQEMMDAQWGINDQLGELSMMQSVAQIIADRWPDDEQLGLIWMNLGYLYEAFNHPETAITIYEKIPQKSKQYAEAQIAAGTARWLITRRHAIQTGSQVDKARSADAQRMLTRGLQQLEKSKPKLDERLIEVRLALAQIALTNKQANKAQEWLVFNDKSIVDQLRVGGAAGKKDAVAVSDFIARQIFDVLYYAHRQLGDEPAANTILETMVATIDAVEIDLEAKQLSAVKRAADRLKAKAVVTRQDIAEFAELVQPMLDEESRFPTDYLLWLGESWGQLADRVQDSKSMEQCATRAAEVYGLAISRTDFPAGSVQSAQLRRIELLRQSGNRQESLRLIEEMLAKSPNVFALQIEAARTLQDAGIASGKASDLQAAIDGPQGFSPIWGWGRLVSTLYATRWSSSGTDTHAQQLLLAQYHMAQCQSLLAERIRDRSSRQMRLAEISRSLQQAIATMDDSNPWAGKFRALAAAVKRAE